MLMPLYPPDCMLKSELAPLETLLYTVIQPALDILLPLGLFNFYGYLQFPYTQIVSK